jgi:hypothetical protein
MSDVQNGDKTGIVDSKTFRGMYVLVVEVEGFGVAIPHQWKHPNGNF